MQNNTITWKNDEVHNTVEGWIDDKLYFDIEKTETDKVILHQMKKPLMNCSTELPSIEEAKKYCEKIKPIK